MRGFKMIQVMQLDFKNKISGSTVENHNYALLNGKELTQEQYNNIFATSLKLHLTEKIGIDFYFKIPVAKEKVQYVDIHFTSKATDKYVLLRCNEDAKYQSKDVFVQAILRVPTVSINSSNVLYFKMYGNANIDFEVYGINVNVVYDDQQNNIYSGVVNWNKDSVTEIVDTIKQKSFADIITQLQAYPLNTVQFVTFNNVGIEIE